MLQPQFIKRSSSLLLSSTNPSIIGMPRRGGGGYGGTGGSGDKGGSSSAKIKRITESPEENEARLRTRREKCAALSPEEKEARLRTRREKWEAVSPEEKGARVKKSREKYGGPLTVQAVTHLLIALLFPQCTALLVQ